MASLLIRPQGHYSRHARTSDTIAIRIEFDIRTPAFGGQLQAYPFRRKYRSAAEASRLGTGYCAAPYVALSLRFKYLEYNLRGCPIDFPNGMPQRSFALGFLAQPERPHERNFSATVRRLAAHRPRPQIRDWCRTIRVDRLEISQLLLSLAFDFGTSFPQFVCQTGAMSRNVLQHDFEDQASHGVQVTGKSFAA